MQQLQSGPQVIGSVLDDGFRLFRLSFKSTFPIAAIGSLVPGLLAGYYAIRGFVLSPTEIGVGGLLVWVLLCPFNAAVVSRTSSLANHEDLPLLASCRTGLIVTPAFFAASLLGMATMMASLLPLAPVIAFVPALGVVAVVLGVLLLALPIAVSVLFFFAPYAVAIERIGPLEAFGRSFTLVRKHWLRAAMLLTVAVTDASVLYIGASFAFAVLLAVGFNRIDAAAALFLNVLLTALVGGVVTPFMTALVVASYRDLELRREGDDLAGRIAAIA